MLPGSRHSTTRRQTTLVTGRSSLSASFRGDLDDELDASVHSHNLGSSLHGLFPSIEDEEEQRGGESKGLGDVSTSDGDAAAGGDHGGSKIEQRVPLLALPSFRHRASTLKGKGIDPALLTTSSRGLDSLPSFRGRAGTIKGIDPGLLSARGGNQPPDASSSSSSSSSPPSLSLPSGAGDGAPRVNLPSAVIRHSIDEILSFSYSLSGTGAILSLILLFFFGLYTGGPAVMVWGWLVAAFFSAIVVANISEICSAYPRNAGSVYYWAGQLAPKQYAPVVSYWTGVFALFAYTAYASSYAYGFAVMCNCAVQYTGFPAMSNYETAALAIGTIASWGVVCYLRINYHDILSHISAFLQISLALLIIGVVTGTAKSYNSPEYVFLTGVNPDFSDGFYQISFILAVGVVSQFYPLNEFSTKDGAVHTGLDESESAETEITSSGALLDTGIVTGVLGLSLLLALLFTVDTDVDVSASDATAIEVVRQTSGGTAAIVFSWYAAVSLFMCGLCHVPNGIGLLHTLVKDRLLPWSEGYLDHLDASLYPVYCMVTFCVATAFVLLGVLIESENGDIAVGGTHLAFFAILQTCNFAFQVSFGIPIFLKITFICPMASRAISKATWYLENASVPLGWIAFIWLALTAVLELLPMKFPVTAVNMNYTIVIVAFVTLLGELNWELNCRYHFRGPKRSDDDVDYAFHFRRLSQA